MIGSSLGLLEIVEKYPSVGGGKPPIARPPCLDAVMASEQFWKQQKTNILWSSSGLKFLSPMHCLASGVLPGCMSGQMYKSCFMYLSKIHLERGCGFSCAWGAGSDGVLGDRDYHRRCSIANESVVC